MQAILRIKKHILWSGIELIQETLKPQNALIINNVVDAVVHAEGTQFSIEVSSIAQLWILVAAAKD